MWKRSCWNRARAAVAAAALLAGCHEPAPPPPPSPPAAPPPAAVEGPKLLPVDEGPKDPTFVAFRDELLSAIQKRDFAKARESIDRGVRTSFGDEGPGIEAFRSPDSRLWGELEGALALGGTFRDQRFWAPYVYSAWPDEIDAFEYLAVIAKDVPLREAAINSSKPLATLSYDIVKRAGEPGDATEWQQVTSADGRAGWVERRYVRSPVGYRAGFVKKDGRWKLEALVSGD